MGTNAATVAVFANNVGSFHTHVHIRRHLNAFECIWSTCPFNMYVCIMYYAYIYVCNSSIIIIALCPTAAACISRLVTSTTTKNQLAVNH